VTLCDASERHEDCLTTNSRSTGPQQQNTDEHNCPVDMKTDHLLLTGGLQMLMTVCWLLLSGVQPQLLFALISVVVIFSQVIG